MLKPEMSLGINDNMSDKYYISPPPLFKNYMKLPLHSKQSSAWRNACANSKMCRMLHTDT